MTAFICRQQLVLARISSINFASRTSRSDLSIVLAKRSFCEKMSFQKAKDKYLSMSTEEKRARCKDYIPLDKVPTWEEYFKQNKDELAPCREKKEGEVDAALNQRVSLWKGDITKLEVGAITNAANTKLFRGAGVCGAIHDAAGDELEYECDSLDGCDEGKAKLTGGYRLPAKYVIQAVGPHGEKPEKLRSCYSTSLELAVEHDLRSVAFPCISTGIFGYPPKKAAKEAVQTVHEFLKTTDKIDRVIFCVFLPADQKYYEEFLQVFFPVE